MIPQKKTINYDFIDSLRFISIIAIVIEHSYLYPKNTYFSEPGEQIIQATALQLFKFGTIFFYILAGFLIGDKIKTTTSVTYLKRRFDNTIKPWLFWIVIFISLRYINFYVIYHKSGTSDIFSEPLYGLAGQLYYIIFDTSFWFILNFLICIVLLLIFKKYLYSYKLGFILLLCSLFYSLNLYHGWIITRHTTAMFGFVFYLWLGVQLYRYYDVFNIWIKKQKAIVLAAATLICLALACYESIYIMNTGLKIDPYNTLRITNIIYSLAAFLFLYKIAGNLKWIRNLNPRSTTFGIYLIHYLIVAQILPMIFNPLHISGQSNTSLELVGIQYIRFLIVYISSYVLVYLIHKSKRMKWVVGQ